MRALGESAGAKCSVVVGIPVHNEEAFIGRCLAALAGQIATDAFAVVALLNNCTDRSCAVVRGLAGQLPFRLHIHQYWLDPACLNAGVARRLAMEHAAEYVEPGGVLMTTDADSEVAADWIETNLAWLSQGADAVAGMALLDEADAARLPAELHAAETRVILLATLLDEIDWHVDPLAHDPWPRHTEHSGASIAVRASLFHRAGGIPAIPLGEDRAFFDQLGAIDAKIRHAPDVRVRVSGRVAGRAKGGMADTIASRLREPDPLLDSIVEPAADRLRRAMWRRRLRQSWASGSLSGAERIARDLAIPLLEVGRALQSASFGRCWAMIESRSLKLQRKRIPTALVEEAIADAERVLQPFRTAGQLSGPADPAGIPAWPHAAAGAAAAQRAG